MIDYTITLDANKRGIQTILQGFRQHETGRRIIINVCNQSEAVNLAKATIELSLPSVHTKNVELINNALICVLDEGDTEKEGYCHVRVLFSNPLYHSLEFVIEIEKAPNISVYGLFNKYGKLLKSWDALIIDRNITVNDAGTIVEDCDLNERFSDEEWTLIVGKDVEQIGWAAFNGKLGKVNTVILPDACTIIDGYAFGLNNNLTNIKIGRYVTDINANGFANIPLKSIKMPDTVKNIGNGAFTNTNIKSVVIPPLVTKLEQNIFNSCEKLESVDLSNVSVISLDVFYYCTALKELDFKNVREITCGDGKSSTQKSNGSPFRYSGLESVKNFDDIVFTEHFISVSEGRLRTSFGLFRGCNLKEFKSLVVFPGNNYCGEEFMDNANLESVDICLTFIPRRMFMGCKSLKTVNITGSYDTIRDEAFAGCEELEFVIPDSVRYIDTDAFKDVKHIYYHGTATGSPWGAKAIN